MYTVSETGARTLCLVTGKVDQLDNSYIFALSDKLQKNQLTSNLLLHYLAKVECLALQLFSILVHLWHRYEYLQYLSIRDAKFCFSYVDTVKCVMVQRAKITCSEQTRGMQAIC